MTEDQGKENSPSDRLDEIKSEEKEDASSYYAQGESKDNVNEEAELSKPVEDVDAQKEEMNMLKAVAFLGFGMAALAIIFILFFVRDLDTRVVDVDGAITSLEEKIAPLRKHVDDSLDKVNQDIAGLDNKIGNYERIMAVMELKRALVTVQEMSMGDSANVKAKSNQVVAGIESLLVELGAGTATEKMPAGIVSLEEAPAPAAHAAPVEEPAHAEEPAPVEEPAHAEEPAVEEPAAEEPVAAEEASEASEEEAPAEDSGGEEDDEDEDEDE
ncbi:MAG: hypothetical protein HOK41_11475 [Nitrospina sp.]|jgi:cell division protein FtsL|nr:hypothetical protein [Nitrospina sp.]MBT6717828.1 hypothetical protein [Nitrospina sp.]